MRTETLPSCPDVAPAMHDEAATLELTILMPCLNEAETLARCIVKAQAYLARSGVAGEVVIADNGSTDGSQAIAEAHGARVVPVAARGYGSALIGGIRAARGRYVIMGDSDDSYDFNALEPFVEELRQGAELVMGNRFKGGIMPGAMPKLHRYLGNPVLTAIGRLFFRSPCGDFHCGLRGFSRDAILRLDLQAPGMEFASEMVVKATIQRLRIAEVATILHPDGRSRPPHLRSWRDGWRHLRFLLLFSPRWLFLYPGFILFAGGLGGMAWLLPQARAIGGVTLDIHSLLYAAVATVVGLQSVLFWVFTKIYGTREGMLLEDENFNRRLRRLSLERGLVAGGLLLVLGVVLGAVALGTWGSVGYGSLHPEATMRLIIPSATAILLGFQLIYGCFFISVLEIRSSRSGG
ncbi:glycosyltransferase family 2 protein [Limobrevibacterium gyesilva]|uniref:Glycosyltransferase family 2 protein n=1 Tax=Limobrevibacterium gyesilva TaxID=2991712 RepID=A0AA42CEN5_9PROT|nr:glycosyltransferase family 2 protein [Limobrevibacterium gyesilva]MCW3473761.1 glycosyltransferase family 2 protein [Limobrevibacterium gyesilva]